jgi:hypothetical protein
MTLVTTWRNGPRTWKLETHARSMCAMHDVTGVLSLVMTDVKWQRITVNLTNPVDVAAGQPAVYRARPIYDIYAQRSCRRRHCGCGEL